MACCRGGCSKAAAAESTGLQLEIDVLETQERSVKFAFTAPRTRSQRFVRTSSDVTEEYVVSILGGPDSDLRGAREERIAVRSGCTFTHEVVDLMPETEYTIRVRSASESSSQAGPQGIIEIRTAEAKTALLAGEDWGGLLGAPAASKGAFKQGDYEAHKGATKKAPGGGVAAFAGGAAWSGGTAAAAAAGTSNTASRPAAADSADDASTVAPSDTGADTGAVGPAASRQASVDRLTSADDDDWLSEPEASTDRIRQNAGEGINAALAGPASPLRPEDVQPSPLREVRKMAVEAEVTENSPVPRTPKCNLCSIMDCLKRAEPQTDASEIRVDLPDPMASPDPAEQARNAPPAVQQVRKFRPYRAPFPGRAVDPRSVGLEHLEAQNREAIKDRC